MGLTNTQLRDHLDAVAANDKVVAAAIERCGYPEERIRPTGYKTLLRTIVGQQVSVAAAASVWNKLEAELGEDMHAHELLARDFDTLRARGPCANSSPAANSHSTACPMTTRKPLPN
jgi:DNA-3-methyladenine glycosylase II